MQHIYAILKAYSIYFMYIFILYTVVITTYIDSRLDYTTYITLHLQRWHRRTIIVILHNVMTRYIVALGLSQLHRRTYCENIWKVIEYTNTSNNTYTFYSLNNHYLILQQCNKIHYGSIYFFFEKIYSLLQFLIIALIKLELILFETKLCAILLSVMI